MFNLSKYFLTIVLTVQLSNHLIAQEAVKADVDGARATREIFLVKDVPQTLTFEFEIGEIAVGNPGIVSVVADRPRRRIVLSPLTTGETALLVFDSFGKQRENVQTTVTSTDLDQFVKDLSFLLRDIEGLSYRRVGRKVVIEGEVFLKSDLDRIRDIIRGNEFVVDLVTLSQDTQRILARRIRDEINISGVEVVTVKDKVVLKGEVSSEQESKRADKLASIYVSADQVVNALTVNTAKASARAARLIQVTAYFVEVNKSFLRNFNFKWTPIANVQLGYFNNNGNGGFNLSALLTDFLPSLNTAKALGVARLYENPTVSVKSGDSAKIFSGARVLLPIAQPNGFVTVGGGEKNDGVQTGVTLDVTPTVDEREFIDLKMSIEVSKLGSSVVPQAIQTNQSSVSTTHYLRSGETVAVGGVLRSAFTDAKDAPPGQPFAFQAGQQSFESSLGNIFQIFKSRATTADRTMSIIFITPEVLNSARDASKNLRESLNLEAVEPKVQGVESLE